MSTLYIIATPIGNASGITERAVRTLSSVSAILAEDTRVTHKLLSLLGIRQGLIAWHEHSDARAWERIRVLLAGGSDLCYVTDAGTPGVSDPGGRLIELVRKELPDVHIVPIPGPSALAAAISVAGIPLSEFLFLGFLPHKKGRQTALHEIAQSARPVILFESVHRIRKLLAELAESKMRVVVCRELTKKFETVYRGTAAEVLEALTAMETKGEFVVIAHRYDRT